MSHLLTRSRCAAGPWLEEMVQETEPVDLRYVVRLLEAGGILPRWQELPASAKITASTLWRRAPRDGSLRTRGRS